MDVGLTPMLFVLTASLAAVQSRIDTGPRNALKKVGDSVTLECVTDNKNCEGVEWSKQEGTQSPNLVYRDARGMLNNNKYPPDRYSVNTTGGCHLSINQLVISDSGKFTCMHRDADSVEFTSISVLVVIDVGDSCQSNVTSGALVEGDVYSFLSAINVPDKSVEPSNVNLSFQNKAASETETTDLTQPNTVKTTLAGMVTKQNRPITERFCRASFTPMPKDNLDNTTATLDICTTQPFVVSYPVENIAVFPPGPYNKGDTVRCTADGSPLPTFKWTNSKSGEVFDGDTLVIKDDFGNNYICTAVNTVNGKSAPPLSVTIQVSPPSESIRPIGLVGIGVLIGVGGMLVLDGVLFAVVRTKYEWIKRTDDKRTGGMKADSARVQTSRDTSTDPQYELINDRGSPKVQTSGDTSTDPQYELINAHSAQNSNAGPTYAQLTISTNVDVIGQSLSDRVTYLQPTGEDYEEPL